MNALVIFFVTLGMGYASLRLGYRACELWFFYTATAPTPTSHDGRDLSLDEEDGGGGGGASDEDVLEAVDFEDGYNDNDNDGDGDGDGDAEVVQITGDSGTSGDRPMGNKALSTSREAMVSEPLSSGPRSRTTWMILAAPLCVAAYVVLNVVGVVGGVLGLVMRSPWTRANGFWWSLWLSLLVAPIGEWLWWWCRVVVVVTHIVVVAVVVLCCSASWLSYGFLFPPLSLPPLLGRHSTPLAAESVE